jgi:hypothetical protein
MNKEEFIKQYNKILAFILINKDSDYLVFKDRLDTLVLDFIENLEQELIVRNKELGILNDEILYMIESDTDSSKTLGDV